MELTATAFRLPILATFNKVQVNFYTLKETHSRSWCQYVFGDQNFHPIEFNNRFLKASPLPEPWPHRSHAHDAPRSRPVASVYNL